MTTPMLAGPNITVVILIKEPYVGFSDGLPTGFIGEVWLLLSQILQLTCRYIVVTNATEFKDGDVFLHGPKLLSSSGLPILSFAYSWYNVYLTETSLLIATLSYLNNWSFEQWILTAGTVILFVTALFGMLRIAEKWYPSCAIDLPPLPLKAGKRVLQDINWRRSYGRQYRLRTRNEESFSNCFMAGVAAVSGQGGVIFSHVPSIRLLVLSFLLFGMIICSAFSALLVSQFTTGLHVNAESVGRLCFRKDSVKLRVADLKPRTSCLDVICSPHFAILETPELVRHSNPRCTLVVYRDRLFPFQISFNFVPTFDKTLRKTLQVELWRLRETGLVQRLRSKWLRPPETTLRRRTTYTVSIDQVAGAFYTYLVAILCSAGVLIIEKVIYHTHLVHHH